MSDTPHSFEFNPNSPNAMFQRVLSKLEEQERRDAERDVTAERERREIKSMITAVNTDAAQRHDRHEVRLAKLERFVITHKAKVALLITLGSGAVSAAAWFIQQLTK